MNRKIEKIKCFRLFLLKEIDALTAGQLNTTPEGHNNNIIWNIGHMISAQQNMCYVRSGLPVTIPEKYFSSYLSGTRPAARVEEKEITEIKTLFTGTIGQLQTDLDNNLFTTNTPSAAIQQVYGFAVNNIDDVLEYLLYHDGLHSGYIMTMKRKL